MFPYKDAAKVLYSHYYSEATTVDNSITIILLSQSKLSKSNMME